VSTQKEAKNTHMSTSIEDRERFFIKRLREEREKARISQIDLAFKAELSQNLVNFIETGKRIPNLHTIFKLCEALDINPGILFNEPDEQREAARDTIIELARKYI
jgi:transcriptional regulator with XRE-family HTH domain